ncbi:hypothetical protein [Lentibacillus salinarum]|uniref:DUF4825 domain-containing protein n=1 Tax=Lentibacillus salinarum TaxID=446820 RepID=A0ABW3ZXN7_9BACI
MKKWMIWTGLTVIVLASAGAFFVFDASAKQSYLSNADEITKQWETEQVNQSSIEEFSQSVKDDDIISEIKMSPLEKGFNVQVITKQTLPNNEIIQLGQELLNLLFQNQEADFVSLSLYPEDNDQTFIQIRADQTTYLANENDFLAGIERMTIMNEGE